MCNALEANELDPATPFTMLVVPRGTYKSSLASRCFPVWKQLRRIFLDDNPYHRIVLVSATLRLGEAHMAVIEMMLRNSKALNEAYGPLWQNRSHGTMGSKDENGINMAQRVNADANPRVSEPSFWVGSLKAAQTGLHADEAIVDDMNDSQNTATPHQRLKTHDHWRLLFPLIGSEDGSTPRITLIATPWHDGDVRGMILREEREAAAAEEDYVSPWRVVHRGAINDDGTPFFPTKYPLPRLEELRAKMGPRAFAGQYLCDPVGDMGFVNEDQIVFKPRGTFPALRDGRICVDPNQHTEAKEAGCYAAIVVAGYDRFAALYVIDAAGSREWSTQQLIDQLFDLQEAYPYPIFMEDSHMGHFAHAVSMEEARRSKELGRRMHLRINYVPVDVKTSKYERWQKLHPRFARHAAFFAEEIPPKIKLEIKEELIRGEASRFNDFLDALAQVETGVRPRLNKDGTFKEIGQPLPEGIKKTDIVRAGFTGGEAFPDFKRFM